MLEAFVLFSFILQIVNLCLCISILKTCDNQTDLYLDIIRSQKKILRIFRGKK